MPLRPWGRMAAAVFAAVTATSSALGAHVRLVNEGDAGPLYECSAAACVPARTDDPSRTNRSQMDFYVLPGGCVELAGAALRPDGPGVDVECGSPGSSTSYRCEAGACRPLDPATDDDGASSTAIQLPADCGTLIHELIVLRVGTDTQRIYVACDASSGPAGAM